MKAWSSAIQKRYGIRRNNMEQRTHRLDPQIRSTLREEVAASLGDVILVPEEQLQVRQELDEINQDLEQAKGQLEKFQSAEQFVGMRIYKYRKALDQQAQELLDQQAKLAEAAATATAEGQTQKRNEDDETTNNVTRPLVANESPIIIVADDEEMATNNNKTRSDEADQNDDDQKDDGGDEGGGDDVVVNAITKQVTELELQRKMEKWEDDDKALMGVVDHHKDLLANIERMRRKIDELEQKRMDIISMTEECRQFLVASWDEPNYDDIDDHDHVDEQAAVPNIPPSITEERVLEARDVEHGQVEGEAPLDECATTIISSTVEKSVQTNANHTERQNYQNSEQRRHDATT